MNYKFWLDTSGVSFLFWLLWALALFAGFAFYSGAFYLTLRDNLPRNVKVKSGTWLFLFTLYFFEVAVMSGSPFLFPLLIL
jgi:hypothetical protein